MSEPIYELKAELFRSLAHPVRIRVLELLALRPHTVGELLGQIDVAAPHLSQQLAVLRRAGVVSASRDGSNKVYEIEESSIVDLLHAAKKFLLLHLASTAARSEELRNLNYGAGN